MNTTKNILLAGSSHTSLVFLYVKRTLEGKAIVNKLPEVAGNTDEILLSLPVWPLAENDIIHVYAGHRDLMLDKIKRPIVNPEKFTDNLTKIIEIILSKTSAKIVFSNIPPVADIFLETDPERNQRIQRYNWIIEEVTSKADIPLHDFSTFTLSHNSDSEIYSDGLHFTRDFYKKFAANLADYLIRL